jgi:hypothetical protein
MTKSSVSLVFSSNVIDMSGHYVECAGHLAWYKKILTEENTGFKSQKTVIFIVTSMTTSDFLNSLLYA